MFRSIWQIISSVYTQRRSGIDKADIRHLRADLRFRLALVEYAYFGRSGKRVRRAIAELKSVVGEKAVHRYLRSLDPDLRTQFVERFQGARRDADAYGPAPARHKPQRKVQATAPSPVRARPASATVSNVVPINSAARKTGGAGARGPAQFSPRSQDDSRSVDSGE